MKPPKILSFLFIVCMAAFNCEAQTSRSTKYTKVTNDYVMVLRQGDTLFSQLLHIHGTGSDRNFSAFGGHILSAVVSTGSPELFITVTIKKFERIKEEN